MYLLSLGRLNYYATSPKVVDSVFLELVATQCASFISEAPITHGHFYSGNHGSKAIGPLADRRRSSYLERYEAGSPLGSWRRHHCG